MSPIRLTQYSHGAGCGCKISPKILTTILEGSGQQTSDPNLWVGNQSRDDAAVYGIDETTGIISTTDFFMPIVDDPYDFGRIAATNAISDIYAMGGTPIMAIAILGWPIDKLSPKIAREVIAGGRKTCDEAGIILAGGHSIDAPEPIFGLAVTGTVEKQFLKKNSTANVGDCLFLTKPLGIGILTTAEKQGLLQEADKTLARDTMIKLNSIGAKVARLPYVSAMTDVTGFGLLGHLIELCEGSGLSASLYPNRVPLLNHVDEYVQKGAVPGGMMRNFESYGHNIKPSALLDTWKPYLCDPQTSGGLLIAVNKNHADEFAHFLKAYNIETTDIIGVMEKASTYPVTLENSN